MRYFGFSLLAATFLSRVDGVGWIKFIVTGTGACHVRDVYTVPVPRQIKSLIYNYFNNDD